MAPSSSAEEEELIRSTLEALEGLGLHQLSSVETSNSIISGDLQDYADTTELPKGQVRVH